MPIFEHDGTNWVEIPEDGGTVKVHEGGGWFDINVVEMHDGTAWQVVWQRTDPEPPPPEGPDEGTYVLSPTGLYLPSTPGASGYAEFNTTAYRGYISEIRARIHWSSSTVQGADLRISGRTSGTYYRTVNDVEQWLSRTIDHRIDSYSYTSLTEFNNGSAYGFSLLMQDAGAAGLSYFIDNVQLVITV